MDPNDKTKESPATLGAQGGDPTDVAGRTQGIGDSRDPTLRQTPNDTKEGIVRDPVYWNGQLVSYVKDVGTADPEYDGAVKKVVIQMPGGATQVVPESEIMRDRKVAQPEGAEYDRPSGSPASVGPAAERSSGSAGAAPKS